MELTTEQTEYIIEELQELVDRLRNQSCRAIEFHFKRELVDGPPVNGWATRMPTGECTITVRFDSDPNKVGS